MSRSTQVVVVLVDDEILLPGIIQYVCGTDTQVLMAAMFTSKIQRATQLCWVTALGKGHVPICTILVQVQVSIYR